MEFGAILRACRERAGLTQEQLAERLHRSRSCISKLETNNKTLDAATLIKWGDVTAARDVVVTLIYGIDPSTIIDGVQNLVVSMISLW